MAPPRAPATFPAARPSSKNMPRAAELQKISILRWAPARPKNRQYRGSSRLSRRRNRLGPLWGRLESTNPFVILARIVEALSKEQTPLVKNTKPKRITICTSGLHGLLHQAGQQLTGQPAQNQRAQYFLHRPPQGRASGQVGQGHRP